MAVNASRRKEELAGGWLADATGVPDARLEGIHLRLPGFGDGGPTLEIFTYTQLAARLPAAANRPGFTHIAFAVEDVQACRDAVLAAGGREVGQVVCVQIPGAGEISVVYMADPEGNLIELQRWSGA